MRRERSSVFVVFRLYSIIGVGVKVYRVFLGGRIRDASDFVFGKDSKGSMSYCSSRFLVCRRMLALSYCLNFEHFVKRFFLLLNSL